MIILTYILGTKSFIDREKGMITVNQQHYVACQTCLEMFGLGTEYATEPTPQ